MMNQLTKTALAMGLATAVLTPAGLHAESAQKSADAKADTSGEMLNKSFDSLAKTLKNAREQVSKAVSERDAAKASLAESRKEAAHKDKVIAELKKEVADSRKSAAEWKQKHSREQQLAAEWKAKAEKMENRLAVGEKTRERMLAFRGRLDETIEQYSGLQKELVKLEQELGGPREKAAMVKENASLKQATADLAKKVEIARKEKSVVAEAHEATSKRLAGLKKNLMEKDKAVRVIAERHRKETDRLAAELKDARQKAATAARRREALESEIGQLKKRLSENAAERKALVAKAKKAGMAAKADEIKKLDTTAESHAKRAQQLAGELKALKSQRDRAREALAQREDRIKRLEGKLRQQARVDKQAKE